MEAPASAFFDEIFQKHAFAKRAAEGIDDKSFARGILFHQFVGRNRKRGGGPRKRGGKGDDQHVPPRLERGFDGRLCLFRRHLKGVTDVSFAQKAVELLGRQLFALDPPVGFPRDGVAQRQNGDAVRFDVFLRHAAASIGDKIKRSFHKSF